MIQYNYQVGCDIMDFKTKEVKIDDMIFDKENPRFIDDNSSQKQIYEYLINYENIIDLAKSIEKNGFQNLGERIICLEYNNKYIVLEGNRRLAACKYLLNYSNVKLNKILCDIVKNREDADYIIASKHISGIKTWPPITKKYFYAKKFISGHSIEEISRYSPEPKAKIKDHIIQYLFIKHFYDINNCNLPENEKKLEKIDTDILGSRILSRLKETLNFNYDNNTLEIKHSNKYSSNIFDSILKDLGKALWEDKTINTRTINKKDDWEKLINDNDIIPGLKNKIDSYSNINDKTNNNKVNSLQLTDKNTDYNQPSSSKSNSNIDNYYQSISKPTKISNIYKRQKLISDSQQMDLKVLCESNIKIHSTIYEISRLKIDENPLALTFLLRALCEYIVQLHDKHKKSTYYNKNDLNGSLLNLTNYLSSTNKLGNKESTQITYTLKKEHTINLLNGSIHNLDIQPQPTFLIEIYDSFHPLFSCIAKEFYQEEKR